MKKIVALLIIASMTLIASGCGKEREVYEPRDKDPVQQEKHGKDMWKDVEK
jgi:hypothetical protein